MITVTEYAGKTVGIFGLGKAGISAVTSLLIGGAKIFIWDDNEENLEKIAQRYAGKVHAEKVADWPWAEMSALILSPGIPLTHPKPHESVVLARQFGVPVIGDIELLYRAQPKARYVGITGTNGKSTTTTLIGHILKQNGMRTEVGGNLGTPALDLAPLGEDGVYVIELSSYQLDLVQTTHFNVAVLLNITPDHLDRHGDMKGYIKAKMRIFERQIMEDTSVVAVDDEHTQAVATKLKTSPRRLVQVSAQHPTSIIYVENGILHDGAQQFDLVSIVTLTGRHNWQNAAAAYAACKALGMKAEAIYYAMKSFGGLRHRLQHVATVRDVRFINDSKATNADATANALAPYETIYWIAGGKPKAGGIESLGAYFPKIAHAFLIGQAQDEFAATLQGKVANTLCGTLKTALEKASAMAFSEGKKGAVVLLSPACASFDQFKSFEERGDVFCSLVEAIAAREEAA